MALLARGTWLPYGDLHHYAHSAHPAVRWNYLPALEAGPLGTPAYAPRALLLGEDAVAHHHFRALTSGPDPEPTTSGDACQEPTGHVLPQSMRP